MSRLLPCPFCSSADVELRDKPFHYVACNNCGSRTGGGPSREAEEVWNCRPAPDRDDAVALREKIARNIARELDRQDSGDPGREMPDGWDLTLDWIDQGQTDLGLVADAILEAMGEGTP